MNVLYACTLYPPAIGGAQIHLHHLAKQVQLLGHSVRVITSACRNRDDWLQLSTFRPEERRDYVHEGIRVSQLGYPMSSRLRMVPPALTYYALMRPSVQYLSATVGAQVPWPSEKPSIVHVSRVGREFLAQAALDYARRERLPYALTPNHHPRWRGFLYREYDRIYREADAVFALTSAEKQMLVEEKKLDERRVHVTGIGPVLSENYSAESFRAKHNIHARFVVYLGQQLKYKGIGSLLQAAPLIWKKHPDVRILFIGPRTDYSTALFAEVTDERLINLGSVDLETKTSALAACEMLCLPSMQESFGGVFVEAWSLRKPVIGGRIPPIAGVIDEGQNGLLTSQDPDELAACVNRLLANDSERHAMGDAGWAKVQAKYTWERIARQTLDVYASLRDAAGSKASSPSATAAMGGKAPRTELEGELTPAGRVSGSFGPRRKAKVLLIHNFYKMRGGEDLSFADEALMLERNGHEVVRFTQHNDAISAMDGWNLSARALWSTENYRLLAQLIQRERPDIMHCTNTFPLISPAVYYAARRAGVPVVQSLRNYRILCLGATLMRNGKVCEDCLGRAVPWPGVLHGCYRESRVASGVVAAMSTMHRAMRTWKRAVDLYYTLTEFSRQKFIQGGLPGDKIHVKPNLVYPDPGPGSGDGGYLVFAGRLSPEKGIETMLNAWQKTSGRLRLKIVGEGPLSHLVQKAADDDPTIEWLGHLPLPEVISIIGGASCLLMPSIWYETFGRTIIEAFAKGTPVIASRLGAMAELVQHGVTGLLFEPGSADALARTIEQAVSDPQALAQMRRKARQEYESKYTAETNYRLLMNLYDRAMATPRPTQEVELDLAELSPAM